MTVRPLRSHGRLSARESSWVLDASPHVHARAKRIFGKFAKQAGGLLTITSSPETCRDLRWFLDRYPCVMEPADRTRLDDLADRHVDMIRRLEDLVDADYVPRAFALAVEPRSYQRREAEVYLEKRGLLIGSDVGLGKTASAICSFTDRRTLPAVVIAPAHLPRQWQREIAKFAPGLTTHVLKSGTPYPLPRRDGRGPDVVISSYAKFIGWGKVLPDYARSVVFDEVQMLRHRDSNRYGAAEYLASKADYRCGLSATPIYNYGDEIFNVLNVLQPGALGSHAEFANEWCAPAGGGKMRLRDPKAFGAWARDEFLILRHTRRDVGRELPAVTKITQQIDANRSALDRIKDSAVDLAKLILSGAEHTARWQASEQLSTVLRQATGIAKAPYVADFVRLLVESGERVLLGLWHRECYAIIAAKLKDYAPLMYTGSETTAQKDAAVAAFLAGKSPVLMMSLRSGLGVNGLQKVCSCVVIGELDWSPGVHEQFIGRIDRDDQKTPVIAYYLVSSDGADPAIAEVLGIKREQVEGIRNPDLTFLESVDTSGARGRSLAERYLKQIGQRPDSQSSIDEPTLFAPAEDPVAF